MSTFNTLRTAAVLDVLLLVMLVVSIIFVCDPLGVLLPLSAAATLSFWHFMHILLIIVAFVADFFFMPLLVTLGALVIACIDVFVIVWRITLLPALPSLCDFVLIIFDAFFIVTALIVLVWSCKFFTIVSNDDDDDEYDDDEEAPLVVNKGFPVDARAAPSSTVQRRTTLIKYGVATTP